MNDLRSLPESPPGVRVWGEPTWVHMAVCAAPFESDGSVQGRVLHLPGGSAYATAIGCAHLGARTTFVGPFGEDEAGTALIEEARARGVEVLPIPAGVSRETVIVVDVDGQRGMISESGGSYAEPWSDRVGGLGDGGVTHVSMTSLLRTPPGSVEALLRRSDTQHLSVDAGSAGLIASNPAVARGVLERLNPTVVFANGAEAEALRSTGWERASSVLVEKAGDAGAVVWTDTGSFIVPVPERVECVDSTGAGDAFAAGFLSAWQGGVLDLEAAVMQAHRYAARAVSIHGTVVPV